MLYTITLNPSLDLAVRVKELKPGMTNRSSDEYFQAGGKGLNVSAVLKALGFESIAIGYAAGFVGAEILRLSKEQGLRTDFILLDRGCSRINFKIREGDDANILSETEVNGSGPLIDAAGADALYEKLEHLTVGDTLIISGSAPPGRGPELYDGIPAKISQKGVRFVADTSGKNLLKTLKYRPFLVKPNLAELSELAGRELSGPEEVSSFAKDLLNMGAENILVSMGEEGALLLTQDNRVLVCKAPTGRVINSVGAGDSMVAGFVAGYIEKGDFEYALKLAVASGSACAFSRFLPLRDEILPLLDHIDIRSCRR